MLPFTFISSMHIQSQVQKCMDDEANFFPLGNPFLFRNRVLDCASLSSSTFKVEGWRCMSVHVVSCRSAFTTRFKSDTALHSAWLN
jgi:hypothetical protein